MQRLFLPSPFFALLIWGSLWSSRMVEATVEGAIVQGYGKAAGWNRPELKNGQPRRPLLGLPLLPARRAGRVFNRLFARVRTAQKEQK